MPTSLRSAVIAIVTVGLSAIPATADQACATNHMRARLEVFSEGSLSRPLYWVAENGGQSTFTVRIVGSGCDGSTSTINYQVNPASATSPTDYTHVNQPITFVNTVGHPDSQTRTVNITDDALPLDAAVEHATVKLTSASGGSLIPPTEAPIIIVDDDGATPRVSLAEGGYEESESSAATIPSGGVPVFRAGSVSGTTTVDYTIGGGTATVGSDYTGGAGQLTFAPGDRMELVPVDLVDDDAKELPETMTVTISGTGVEGTTSATFTIIDNEESIPPSSSIHHPNQGRKYKAADFLIREIHIFTTDQGGAGTAAAELAIRRNMKNKSCAWWTGKKFKKGSCDKERWLKTSKYETDFFFIRMKELHPSVGEIKNYTAYSRAIDGAANVETSFEVGRNENTFEVKKAK